MSEPTAERRWGPLGVLGLAQLLMVLDQAVMNVSIAQLVEDFDTDVAAIQGVITAYALVMAALMLTGGSLGDRFGRRRMFAVGHAVYGVGSLTTALAPTLPVLVVGWAVLEGVGAALVMPALVALVASNYTGRDRVLAFAVLGGTAGAGIAIGPILGGWATANLSWRVVFVGEAVLVGLILLLVRVVRDAARDDDPPPVDVVGSVLSATGMAVVVFSILQAGTWGWLAPKSSPVEPFGFALTPFGVLAGAAVLAGFARWERHRTDRGGTPLVDLELLRRPQLRTGLAMLLSQNLMLLGIFFTIPLYLQIVQGLDAFETGLRMLPVSLTMLLTAVGAPRLLGGRTVRSVVRGGLLVLLVAVVGLLATVRPDLGGIGFGASMAALGVGMGLLASQLGNVVQSAVDESERSAAGGLQFTAQQAGAAVGTALIGAIVLSSLGSSFVARIQDDPEIGPRLDAETATEIQRSIQFVPSDVIRAAVVEARPDAPAEALDAVVEPYEDAQIQALRAGLATTAVIVLAVLALAGGLPDRRPDELVAADQIGSGPPAT